jgi:hypothetical protein
VIPDEIYQIKTVESRRFDIAGAVSPIEVEFHIARKEKPIGKRILNRLFLS